jgi:Holliday junction resolvase RusA-like endonuclease
MSDSGLTVQRVVIHDWLPAPLTNVSGDHWRKREKKLKAAQTMVWAYAQQQGLQPVVGRARVTFVLVFPVKRRRDADNLNSRIKGCLDGLVRGKWLVDDSTYWIDLVVRADVRPGVKQLEIEIEAL